jgi:hypothetical protein
MKNIDKRIEKEKVKHNLKISRQISKLSNIQNFLENIIENSDTFELQEALESIVCAIDQLYDAMFMYENPKGSGVWVYYGIEGVIL